MTFLEWLEKAKPAFAKLDEQERLLAAWNAGRLIASYESAELSGKAYRASIDANVYRERAKELEAAAERLISAFDNGKPLSGAFGQIRAILNGECGNEDAHNSRREDDDD